MDKEPRKIEEAAERSKRILREGGEVGIDPTGSYSSSRVLSAQAFSPPSAHKSTLASEDRGSEVARLLWSSLGGSLMLCACHCGKLLWILPFFPFLKRIFRTFLRETVRKGRTRLYRYHISFFFIFSFSFFYFFFLPSFLSFPPPFFSLL